MGKSTVKNRTTFYRERFLERFKRTHGDISKACRWAGVDRSTFYRWLDSSKEFAKQFEHTRQEVVDQLEAEAWRRGITGILKPVFYKGDVVAKVREYSDQLLITLLKANAPEKYRENIETKQTGEIVLRVKYDDSPRDTDKATQAT